MSSDVVVAVLATSGFTAIAGALVTGWFNKRKLGADATEIITRAASGVVERLEDELERRVAKYELLDRKYEALKERWAQEREEWRRVLQLHVAWDAIAIARLGELGVRLPPAPPVLPPSRLGPED